MVCTKCLYSYLDVKMAHFFREIRFRPRDFVKCEIVTMCNGISSGQKKLDSCFHVTLQSITRVCHIYIKTIEKFEILFSGQTHTLKSNR